MQSYSRVEYGGYTFGTKESQEGLKHDDSHIRLDYNELMGRNNSQLKSAFATIKDLFVHEMYPGGPAKVVVHGAWLDVLGTCPIAGTTLVRKRENHPFNLSCKFTFIQTCYQMPVALWPYDPFKKLPSNDPRRHHFDIIDRNQTEQ